MVRGSGRGGLLADRQRFTKAPRVLTPEKIAENEPIVRTDNLLGGIEYSDAYIVDNDSPVRVRVHLLRVELWRDLREPCVVRFGHA